MKFTIKHGLITCLAVAIAAMLLPWVVVDLNGVLTAAGGWGALGIPGLAGATASFSGGAITWNINGFTIWGALQLALSSFVDTVQLGNAFATQPAWIWVRSFLALVIPAGGFTLTFTCFFMAIFSKSKKAAFSISVMQAVTVLIALAEVIVISRLVDYNVAVSTIARMGAGSAVYLFAGVVSVVTAFLLMRSRAETETIPVKGDPSKSGIMCLAGEYQGVSVPLEDGASIIIGRDASCCNLVISGSKISRKHCQIIYDKLRNKYFVTDFSTNGTYIKDGTRLVKEHSMELDPGTIITLGNEANSFRLQ